MRRPKTLVRYHQYIPGESDHAAIKPQQLCATCLLPKHNARHTLPPVPQSVIDEEARRLGETSEME